MIITPTTIIIINGTKERKREERERKGGKELRASERERIESKKRWISGREDGRDALIIRCSKTKEEKARKTRLLWFGREHVFQMLRPKAVWTSWRTLGKRRNGICDLLFYNKRGRDWGRGRGERWRSRGEGCFSWRACKVAAVGGAKTSDAEARRMAPLKSPSSKHEDTASLR